MSQETLDACKAGIMAWQNAFNQGDAEGYASQYAESTEMVAKPFGIFKGRDEIETFWANLIGQGFTEVEYSNIDWQPEGEDGYILTAQWQMNKAYSVFHREHWQIQADGKARLVYDEFEVLGER